MADSQKNVIVTAGSSGGHALMSAMGCTALWYCFDDALARLAEFPALGTLPHTTVFPALLFLSILLAVAGTDWRVSDGS